MPRIRNLVSRVSSGRFSILLDCLLIYSLAGALIWPLFTLDHMNNWASIESTFIADARMLKANLPMGWSPGG